MYLFRQEDRGIIMNALQYTYHKPERLLIGSVKLKMYAPLANKQLRVKTAVLSILMNGFW